MDDDEAAVRARPAYPDLEVDPMSPEAVEKIRRSLIEATEAGGTMGLVRSVAEVTTSTGEIIRIAADAPPGVALDVEIVKVGVYADGSPVGSPCIIEAVSRRRIASGPTRSLGALVLGPGR